MIMDAPGIYSRGLLLCFLGPLLLSRWSGVRSQRLQIIQTPESLSVSAGEELTLNCELSGIPLPGGVRWHKGTDRSQPAIYSQKGEPHARVTRVVPGSGTDFSITIKNVRPEDAGTYYCVKYRSKSGAPDIEEATGKGTVVSVIATPSQPFIQGPTSRVEAGSSVTFNCTSDRFSPREISVTWWKDGRSIQPLQATVLPKGESISYKVWSTAEVQLTKEDVKSQLVCQIEHSTLRSPLKQSFGLGDVLRVPPTIRVETSPPPPIQPNNTVTITCNVENFYPNDTTVVWLENNNTSKKGLDESMTQNWDGTSSLKSSLVVNATEERNLSVFACLVRHNSQPPVNKTATLIIRSQTEGDDSDETAGADDTSIFIIVAVVCLLLVVLVIAIIYLILARHHKGKDPTSVRLHESEKTSGATNQEPDPNNVTYADLNFEKAPQKSPRQVVEISQQSEYASIQAAKPPANDENVTYADLDMVHLSKAPKRPAPKPEEASSEYASVQVQSK